MDSPLQTEQALFDAARRLSADADRQPYLDEACPDPAVRARVAALLRVHDAEQSFLRPPEAVAPTIDAPAASEQPGTTIGPYHLVEVIGEGGMGTVYLAQQQEPVKRLVALKVIKAGMDSKQVLARFAAERQALALMDHPNIAKVLEAGTTPAGRPFFVMELVKGVPITRFCDEQRLTPRERLELFLPVCQAVQHAHQKGVIHRDLKPSNVLVALYDGRPVPKVIDFGVAKAAGQQLTAKTLVTGFGTIVGTLEYMSPEQAEFNQLDIDTRSDIYSLGVLLYELLAGTTPLDRDRVNKSGILEALRIIREEEVPTLGNRLSTTKELPAIAASRGLDPAKLTRLVRGELDWIVMKALEKARARRYQTANSLARDIERYLQDEPVQAGPPSAAYRLRKFARRNKRAVLAASLVVLALVGGIVGTSWQAVNAVRARNAQQEALDQSRLLAAELAFDKGQLLGESGDGNLALLWLARSLKLAPPDAVELRAAIRINLGAWQRQINSVRMVLPLDGSYAVAFAPDGSVVTVDGQPGTGTLTVRRWDRATGQPGGAFRFADETLADAAVAFSPDGRYLLLGFPDGTVRLRELTSGRLVWQRRAPGNNSITRATFSPDGKAVLISSAPEYYASAGGKVQLFDAATGEPAGPVLDHRYPVYAAAFHPDGHSFVTECGVWGNGTKQAEARFWDLTGRETRKPLPHAFMAPAVAFSPDGTKLLTGHWDFKARLWDLAAPGEPVVFQHGGPVSSVDFSPDGKTLLSGSFNGTVHLWNQEGKALGPPLRQGHLVDAVAFSPDGKSVLVVARGNAARLWDLAADGPAALPDAAPGHFFPLAFSPDRQTILTRDAQNTVRLRDAATNQPVGAPLPHERPVRIGGGFVPTSPRHACSSDRRRALTVDADNVARLWDTELGKLVAQLKPVPEAAFLSAEFSPDGKVLVTGNWSAAHVWEASTGRLIRSLGLKPDIPVFQISFRPDARTLMTGDADGAARFWDPDTGDALGPPLPHDCTVLTLALSRTGETVLTGDVDKNVQLWDAAARKRLLQLPGHQSCINDAAFSQHERFVVTGSQDQTARLWHVKSGKPLGPPWRHPGPVIRVAFGADGRTVSTSTEDQMARSWPVPAEMTDPPEEVELWAQVATGMELAADGSVRILDAAAWQERRQRLPAGSLSGR